MDLFKPSGSSLCLSTASSRIGDTGRNFAGRCGKRIKKDPDIQTVLIVSPTYDGIVSDVEAIAKIVHKAGLPLIVDEAHGAHFAYGDAFPKSALELGADAVIQSVHKTLPSLTQTALLHVKITGRMVDAIWM